MSKRRKRGDRTRSAAGAIAGLGWTLVGALAVLALIECKSARVYSTTRRRLDADEQQPKGALVIRTDADQLFRGAHIDPDVVAFLGLRYAGAPVKRLRFMPPTPFTYAPGQVHEARHFGPICMQSFPVDFSRQQLEFIDELGGGRNSSGAPATKASIQLELMAHLLPGGSFFGERKNLPPPGQRLRRQLLEMEQSEDCLNLNIYTPLEALKNRLTSPTRRAPPPASHPDGKPEALLPVLVVVHGHSFDFGAGATVSGLEFARDNHLVVVSFNFRLGILGFPPRIQQTMSSSTSAAPTVLASGSSPRANLGLLDQVALLHWLQANVRSFGGSPQNITLMGVRRGAVLVNLLMLSPLAKGLFARAILEDGSALSPMVANSVQGAASSQQQVALQHIRLLAQLCDCQATWPPPASPPSATPTLDSAASQADVSLIFECLKSAPAEQVMQQIPFGLIDASQVSSRSGEVTLAQRWHKPLELLFRSIIELDQSIVPANFKMTLNEFSNRVFRGEVSAESQVTISRSQLDRLIAYLVASRHLVVSHSIGARRAQSHSTLELVSELLNDLLNVIYLPSNESLAIPIYAPQLDAGIFLQHNEHDLTSAMLQPRSLFSRRDLLIGSSKPLVDLQRASAAKLELEGLRPANQTIERQQSNGLIYPVERFGRRVIEEWGLSDEQAIQQVNLFVRTFYRFHQQEIANSIINHYFLNDQQTQSAPTGGVNESDERQADSGRSSSRRNVKQMHLLRSLMSIHQDALVSVPLMKTALIHSMKQLEELAELFIGQQLAKLNEKAGAGGGALRLPTGERESLGESAVAEFQAFLRRLYETTQMWPIRLLSAVNGTAEGSLHSTYLYQFDKLDSLVRQIARAIGGLANKIERELKARAMVLTEIRTSLLDSLLPQLLEGRDSHELGLGCGLAVELNLDDGEESTLLSRLLKWLCDRISRQVVVSFVAHGNVNGRTEDRRSLDSMDLEARLDQYGADCIQTQPGESVYTLDRDHHSVQLDNPVALTEARQEVNSSVILIEQQQPVGISCREQLNRLTLAYLINELHADEDQNGLTSSSWRVFNVIDQQIATFVRPAAGALWANDYFVSDKSAAGESEAKGDDRLSRDNFDRKIAFWANFIPTLNCSRTQPIGANSLLYSQASNSTLLNMNLNFNCHAGGQQAMAGTRTANLLIRNLELKIKQAINEHLSQLVKQQQLRTISSQQPAANQNHHSLRMAASNEMASPQQEDPTPGFGFDKMNQQTTNMSRDTWLTVDEKRQDAASLQANNSRRALIGIWFIASTVLLSSTLVLIACLLIKRLKREPIARQKRDTRTSDEQEHEIPSVTNQISTNQTQTPKLVQVPSSDLPEVDCSLSSTSILRNQQQANNQDNEYDHGDKNTIGALPNGTPREHMDRGQQPPQQPILIPIMSNSRYLISRQHLNESQPMSHSRLSGDCSLIRAHSPTAELLPQKLSSSSETTTGTNGAHSSVSLLSSSTITTINNDYNNSIKNNGTVGVTTSNGKQPVKKRVKISDPKKRFERSYVVNSNQLAELRDTSSSQLCLDGNFLIPQSNQMSIDFCPVHRSNSAYMIQSSQAASSFTDGDNCDINYASDASQAQNSLEFMSGNYTTPIEAMPFETVGSLARYIDANSQFNGTMNSETTLQRTPSQFGSIQETNWSGTRSMNRRQHRELERAIGSSRVCLVHSQAGISTNVMSTDTSDQPYMTNTLDR